MICFGRRNFTHFACVDGMGETRRARPFSALCISTNMTAILMVMVMMNGQGVMCVCVCVMQRDYFASGIRNLVRKKFSQYSNVNILYF